VGLVTEEERVMAAMAPYLTEVGIERWLFVPNGHLDGRTPMDLIEEGQIDRVMAYIETLADGSF
jgi:hypothetical protein